MLVAMGAGCQTQPRQSPTDTQAARATLPTVLDVTAPAPATTASAPTVAAVEPVAAPAAVTQTPSVAPAATTASGSSYTVKKGDTLFRIAKEHYGDGKKWQQIAAANPGVTPTSLRVGQTLVMPQ
jgi:5'-nucleotidase